MASICILRLPNKGTKDQLSRGGQVWDEGGQVLGEEKEKVEEEEGLKEDATEAFKTMS